MDALRIVPVHPAERRWLEIFDCLLGAGSGQSPKEFGLVLVIHRPCQDVTIAVADGPSRWSRPDFSEAFAKSNRRKLAARVTVTL